MSGVATTNWYGIYYQPDSPTITVTALGPSGYPIGATQWWVNNSKGVQVATGTCNATDTTITVATSGVWASGGTVGVGHYQFYTNTSSPGVAGGGVSQWHRAAAPPGYDAEIWWGTVMQGGSSTVFWNTSVPQIETATLLAFKSTNGASTTWSQVAGAAQNNAASATVAFPSLTGAAGDLYVGVAVCPSAVPSAGSTSGFSYGVTTYSGVEGGVYCYDTNTGSGAVAPTASQASSQTSYAMGVILAASAGTISLDNSWFVGTGSSGATSFTATVAPAAGDVLVLVQQQLLGNAGGGIPVGGGPVGCLFNVCPATNLFDPVLQGYTTATNKPYAVPAWIGVAQDRSYYTDAVSAATIKTTFNADPCFNGFWVDTARPHIPWLSSTTQGATPAWGTTVANMVAQGLTGWTYELPSNEPEFGGFNQAGIIAAVNSARTAVLAADSTAKIMAYCSGGVPETSSYSEWNAVLAAVTYDAASRHSENSVTNLPDLYVMRQDMAQIAAGIAASTNPHAPLWDTETGMAGAYYGCYHPRRHAAHVTKFLLAREAFGWRKELCFTYTTLIGVNSGNVSSGFVEYATAGFGGIRMGGYAAHVMSEALYGTTCSPTAKPTQLNFGPPGSIGDVFFFGLHYVASPGLDVVVLATNGIGYTAGETVTLNVSSPAELVWDGEGRDITSQCTVSGTHITVPVDDLLTYVFLPASTTVTVVDTGSKAISVLSQTNVVASAPSLINEASSAVTGLAWRNSPAAAYNVPGAVPYTDTTIPATVTGSGWPTAQPVVGYAVKGVMPWNNGATTSSAITGFTLKVNGTGVVTVSNASAVSSPIPSGPCGDPATRTTYWDHSFSYLGTIIQQNATSVQLDVTAASYGGEVDAVSVPTFWVPYSVPMLTLADFAVIAVGGGAIILEYLGT